MNNLKIEVRCDPSSQERDLIFNGLVEFNESRAGDARFKEFGILVSDESEATIAGLFGHTLWNGFFISALWVAEAVRRKESDNSFSRGPRSSPFKMVAITFISIPSIFRPEIFTRRTASKYSAPLRITLSGTRDTT
jgi:hypothetical protein